MKAFFKSGLRKAAAGLHHAWFEPAGNLQGKILILGYHRVLTKKELDRDFVQPGIYVLKDVFEKQIRFLKEHFEIVPFEKALQLPGRETSGKSKKWCLITFDDGWIDNYIHAYPVLRTYNVPATIFLPTSLIGTNEWFWPEKLAYFLFHGQTLSPAKKRTLDDAFRRYLHLPNSRTKLRERIDSAIEQAKSLSPRDIAGLLHDLSEASGQSRPGDRMLLNWGEIAEMSEHNIAFGSHTCSHTILTKLSSTDVKTELENSLDALRARKINSIPVLSYPNGNHTTEIAGIAGKAGYRAAVTTKPGSEDFTSIARFDLKRIGIHNDIASTVPLFSFHLAHMTRRSSGTAAKV